MSWKRVTSGEHPMSRHAADVQERAAPPLLPADHVLSSGAVLFPGAFDQHGCPLVVFPVGGQDKLASQLSTAEVMDFIKYFEYQHNKKQEKPSLVSVVADLREASFPTISFIVETLLLLQLQKRTVHTVYVLEPRKKDVCKQLLKLLAPAQEASFKRILLREVPELHNYIDRSQLPWSLGGYLLYRHQSWVTFVKEVDAFAQQFVSVVQRLPSCISTLQALSRLPLPPTLSELQQFLLTADAKFQHLRRELEELLRSCESLVEKLRCPDRELCYQDMAGTTLFTHTAFDMVQNHSRITAAVDRVESLWQQLFSKAHLQLQVFQLRDDALQITEKIEALQQKIQSYKVEVAKDAAEAAALLCDFKASVHAPAMALVHWADNVIQTSAEVVPVGSRPTERWAVDLRRLKDRLESAVNSSVRALRAVCSYHHAHTKASCWYSLVLYQNFIQELLSGLHGAAAPGQLQQKGWGMVPAWRCRLSTFLQKNPPPEVEELLYLAHLADAIPDDKIQQAGRRLSQRCLILRDLLTSSGPVPVRHLQLALQWQYELLSSSHVSHTKPLQPSLSESSLTKCEGGREAALLLGASSFTIASAEGKPPSFSSFDSGFDGAVNSPLEVLAGREGLAGARDVVKAALKPPQIHEILSSVSDFGVRREEPDSGSLGNSSEADSLHPELQLKCSPASSNNPWLGLPVDDLENSYTASRTQNPAPQQHLHFDSSDAHLTASQTRKPREARREVLSSPDGPPSWDWTLHSQSAVEHPELSPIGNILSSTVIGGGDESICSTEGIPTLLWDSYDLHLNPHDGEAASSEEDWDVREQEGLREVEKILDKANQILAEEENVLAQEAELDALLRSEVLCDEDQLGTSSSYELTKAGVLGFEDFLDSAGSDRLSELTSAESACETKSAGGELSSKAAEVPNSADLLTELRTVHILDKLITEQNVKIHELQCRPEGPSPVALSESGERDASQLQLEREEKGSEEGCKVEKDKEVVPGKQSKGTKDQSRLSTDESLITCLTKPIPVVSDLQEPSEEALHEYVCGEELDGSGENAALCRTEDSETRPDDGTRTPLLPPVSEPPMVSLPVSEGLAELRTHSAEVQNVSLGSSRHLVPNPNVMEHGNNNCALPEGCGAPLQLPSETVTKEQRATCSLQLSLQLEEVRLCSDQPLEFDPGGGDEANERPTDGVRISEALRTSYSWSPGSQTQFHSHVNETADLKSTIVLDTGSGLMRAGFADQDLPSVIFPTVIGLPKYEEILNGSLEREAYIGHDAQHMRGVLTLKHPIKNGIIHNWDEMEKIWHHTFQQLGVEPEDHPVLLTEAAMNPLKNREHMVEIMFECFNVPLTYVSMQAVLALYAAGRTTGVVFDSGDGVSHSVPVFEGYCLPHAVQRFPLAGSDVTMHLKKLLQEQGVCMRTTAEEEIVREMKEQCCCVALNYEDELSHGGPSCREVHYTLPDGQVVTLSTERFRAPEILFNPGLIGRDHYGMHESIFKSVLSADIDLRRCLLGNIVLSGGNTLLPGLPDRLQAEIRGLLPTDMVGSVCISSPTDRDSSVWRGGAVLAGSSSFTSAWISREDFEEYGPQIVFRKCF